MNPITASGHVRRRPAGLSSAEGIALWQAGANADADVTTSTGIIASLFDSLMVSLSLMLQTLKNQPMESEHYRFLERSSAALLFWGTDLEVPQGQLDMTLQHSLALRDTVLVILISVGETIRKGVLPYLSQIVFLLTLYAGLELLIASPKKQDELLKTSRLTILIENARLALHYPEECVHFNELPCIEDLCSSLQSKIRSLSILSSSLECPAESECSDEESRAEPHLQDRPAYRYFADLIALRFPRADEGLIESLGKSNWTRFNYVREQRQSGPNEQTTSAKEAKSEFHDSGIGSSASVSAPSLYAATVVSSRAEASHRRLPPLPRTARTGAPFMCEVCGKTVVIRRTKEWK